MAPELRPRCGICGLIHPFLDVCPFVEEREERIEFGLGPNGRRIARTRISRTRYFPRPEVFKAITEATTEPNEDEQQTTVKRKRERVKRQRVA